MPNAFIAQPSSKQVWDGVYQRWTLLIIAFAVILALRRYDAVREIGTTVSSTVTRAIFRASGDAIVPRRLWERRYPFLLAFEERFDAVRTEVMRHDVSVPIEGQPFFPSRIANGHTWKAKKIMKTGGSIDGDAFPVLKSLYHRDIRHMLLSVLKPGTVIKPHRGPYAGYFRVHLGIKCPRDALLTVDGLTLGWEEGRCLVWDDTYVHSVHNRSDEDRVVLFMDIRRDSGLWPLNEAFERVGQLYGY